MVDPVDPLEGGVLDLVDVPPGSAAPDDFGLVQPVDGFGESIVVCVADAADGSIDAGFRQSLGVPDREVLHPSIVVMDEIGDVRPGVERLFEGVERQIASERPGNPPADDAPGEDFDHERHVDESGLCRHIGQVRHPEPIRGVCPEVTFDEVCRMQILLFR